MRPTTRNGWKIMTRLMRHGRPYGKTIGYSRDGWFVYREQIVFCGRPTWRWALYRNVRNRDASGREHVAQRLQAHYRTLRLAMDIANGPVSAPWLGAAQRVG